MTWPAPSGDMVERPTRPKWVKEVSRFLGDTIIDEKYEYPMDGEDDEILDEIEMAVKAILCKRYGHEIENDQCGIRSHRYCVWCGRRELEIYPKPMPHSRACGTTKHDHGLDCAKDCPTCHGRR